MLESVIALAMILRAYEFEAVDTEIPVGAGITLRTTGPARCRIRRLDTPKACPQCQLGSHSRELSAVVDVPAGECEREGKAAGPHDRRVDADDRPVDFADRIRTRSRPVR